MLSPTQTFRFRLRIKVECKFVLKASVAYGLLCLCVYLQYARQTHARDSFIGKHSCRFSYAESSVENRDQPFEIKTDADSNDITEHPHDDLSTTTTGEFAAVSRLRTFPVCDDLRLNVIVSVVLFVIVQYMPSPAQTFRFHLRIKVEWKSLSSRLVWPMAFYVFVFICSMPDKHMHVILS